MGIQRNVAAMIRLFKEQRSLTAVEFSKQLEISRSSLDEYMKGTGNPRVATVDHLAEKLGVDPVVLVSGEFEPSQVQLLLRMLDGVKDLSDLAPWKRVRFAELLLQMVRLWNGKGRGDDLAEKP